METEELVELAVRIPLSQASHLRLLEQLLHWRRCISSQYIMRCHFHKMDPEPTPLWIFQALGLIMALDTDDDIPLSLNGTTPEEKAKEYFEYCFRIWPLESKDSSSLERVLLHSTHLVCPWMGLQIVLHILNRLERYWNPMTKSTDSQDILLQVFGRLPEFQVVWAVVRRELKQPSLVSMESIQWMKQLQIFSSILYFLPLEPQQMNRELLSLGLQVIARYRKCIPWLEKEQRWDISKIFFAYSTSTSKSSGSLEYHWIESYFHCSHLLDAVLNNLNISLSRIDGDSFRAWIASQQGPSRFSRVGQLLYLYALYMQRPNAYEDSVTQDNDNCTSYNLYACIVKIFKMSGCLDGFELHFWLYWLSFACEQHPESANMEQAILQEHRIAWFEHLWIELWRKPFVIWDMKRQDESGTKQRKESCSNYLITLAMIRKLSSPKHEEQQVRRWFVTGVAYFIRLECFQYAEQGGMEENIKWWRDWLAQWNRRIENEELSWLYSYLIEEENGEQAKENHSLTSHVESPSLGKYA